ncbi:MAG: protease modulator HflC [Planctomycetota bacterium]
MKTIIVSIILVIAIILVGSLSVFTVDETEQAIILRLGKYIRTIKDPGLHFKIPLIEIVHKYEDRVLEYDAAAAKVITADKKHLVLDNYARWKIVDPLKFYQAVKDEVGAGARLDDIVFSEIREELARHTLTEIVSVNREDIMHKVAEKCDKRARDYGIEILDVRIKRADLPGEVAHSVYARMKAERQRIAKGYRSEGEEESVKIRAEAEKEKTIMLAESYKIAEKLRGEGDGEAIRIYAEALGRDVEFYEFTRSLEAYEKALRSDTTLILPSDSAFFKYLQSPDAVK